MHITNTDTNTKDPGGMRAIQISSHALSDAGPLQSPARAAAEMYEIPRNTLENIVNCVHQRLGSTSLTDVSLLTAKS